MKNKHRHKKVRNSLPGRHLARKSFEIESLEPRIVLAAPQFVSVQPNGGEVLTPFEVLDVSPRELTVRFDQDIDGSDASLDGIQILRNGVAVEHVQRELGLLGNTVVLRFADALPDNIYSIQITPALQNTLGESFDPNAGGNRVLPLNFELDLGTKVSAVIPQPITRVNDVLTIARNQIEVYFDDDQLDESLVTQPRFYSLSLTHDTVTNTDDQFFLPVVPPVYNAAEAKVTLTFADDLDVLAGDEGTFRLRVGTDEPNPSSAPLVPIQPTSEPGDSFANAYPLMDLSGTSQIVTSTIESPLFPLDFPGSGLEPGRSGGDEPDLDAGVFLIPYNFDSTYGNGVQNLITEPQKQRAREAFEILGDVAGIDVVETSVGGITIATGDPSLAPPGSFPEDLVLNNSLNWNDEFLAPDKQGAPSYFFHLFHALAETYFDPFLGTLFVSRPSLYPSLFGGLGADLSAGDIRFSANDLEQVIPRNDVIVDIQHSFRPDSTDIDLYKFEITSATSGLFSAEILAERQDGFLDSMLRLYREVDVDTRELVAQNDDYFSEDSFLQLELEPGTYYIGVSSTGNDQYDPAVADTGVGGTSQGDYELRLDYRPNVNDILRDVSDPSDQEGAALDGDGDGTPGGAFNFWFRTAAPSGETNRQNEEQEFDIAGATDGTFRIRFEGALTSSIAFDATPADVQLALEALSNVQPGDVLVTGNSLPDGPVSIEFTGNLALTDLSQISLLTSQLQGGTPTITTITNGADPARMIFVDKADSTPDNLPNVGTLANPYNVIHAALNLDIDGLPKTGGAADSHAARPGDIVRILGNGATPEDSAPYQIGLDSFSNQPLPDGAKLDVPNDVTVMVDAGAVFQMRRSAILVGSTGIGVDHSLAAFQVLGTPDRQVVFTSTSDFGAGIPVRGDWGGILFAGDLDQDSFRTRYEELGIFLNHISHADIRYGGGVVNIGSIPQAVVPVDIRDARPTIRFSQLTTNAVAAISATPDSFEETNFHAAEFQSTRFTADYARIGPDISNNRLSGNTINGLLIQIDTPAGSDLEKQTVSGRWDDADIVHVVSDVLEVQGTPGGPTFDANTVSSRLDARLAIDPNVIVKLDRSHIEVGLGAQLIAEGSDGQDVVFTSIQDDRYGASGSFDTSRNGVSAGSAGDWGGIYVGHSAQASIDHAMFTFGGGTSAVEGGFVGFNVVEVQQGQARIANSTFQNNESGVAGSITNREGRGTNGVATVFVRGAQPVIINNTFLSAGQAGTVAEEPANDELDLVPAISINANSLNHTYVVDYGRSTGPVDALAGNTGNQGPLVRHNQLDDNDINGMLVRGETLDTEGVWDDTDIVHVLFDNVHVPNFQTFGGLRLESTESESLVVKLGGHSTVAGFDATGSRGFINDRIGGSLHIVGQPGRPVVLTSISDASVGAGWRPDGSFQNTTLRDGFGSDPDPGGLEISFNFSPEIAANPVLVAGFEAAAAYWEDQITDNVSLSYDVIVVETGSSPAASASPVSIPIPYDTLIERMQLDAAEDESDLLNRLPLLNQITVRGPDGDLTVDGSVSVSYANAKALGFVEGVDFPPAPSETIVGATRDGTINVTALHTRDSVIDGFAGTMIHEIGHTMGFLSSVPENGAFGESVNLTTMDLFRLEPGAGAADFTNSPRMLDPAQQQVFYDGGFFDPVGIDIPGLTAGDIPVSRGKEFEDGSTHPDDAQPSHWRSTCAPGINGIYLGLMDPGGGNCLPAVPGAAGAVLDTDLRTLGLLGWDIGGFSVSATPAPGDWRGIQLDELAGDRNVDTIVERESGDTAASGANSIPDRAEFLGALATGEFEGDENLRLGFEVHGVLNAPNDVDVYSFEGVAGTEVWLDMDNTASSLDSVVELVNVNAITLAISNDSFLNDETSPTGSVTVGGLSKTGLYPLDHFSVNPQDAGMRLTLPGVPGTRGTFYVRVSSAGGDTHGAYELNVRLREVDEVPGSVVKYADIRYARNGVEATGLVAHSPLQTEFVEPGDIDTVETALNLGSAYWTERGEISVSGTLEPIDVDRPGTGVDWYRFNAGGGGIVVDVDYADGAEHPNTNIALYRVGISDGFDADEEDDDYLVYDLVYFGDASSVPSDLSTGLTGGSFGFEDPFIGPIYPGEFIDGNKPELDFNDEERNVDWSDEYLIGIASEDLRPNKLVDQLLRANANDPDSTRFSTEYEEFDTIDLLTANRPFTLDDMTIYVASQNGTALSAFNPFTGQISELGPTGYARPLLDASSLGQNVASLAMRGDGELFALSLGFDDTSSGNWLNIDWAQPLNGDGGFDPQIVDNQGDDAIVTYIEVPPANPGDPPMCEEFGDGIQFFGMTITDQGAVAVGERGGKANPALVGPDYTENIVYLLDAYPQEVDGNTAAPGIGLNVDGLEEPKHQCDDMLMPYFYRGAYTDVIELGRFRTGGSIIQGIAEVGGTYYGVAENGSLYSFTPGLIDTEGASQLVASINPTASFTGLSAGPAGLGLETTLFATTNAGEIYAFDTQGDPQPILAGGADHIGFTDEMGMPLNPLAQGLTFSTLDRNLWEADPDSVIDSANPVLTFAAPYLPEPAQQNSAAAFFTGNESTFEQYAQDFNFPGGSHGVFTLDVGSELSALAPEDRPVLYFDYVLRTENAATNERCDDFRTYSECDMTDDAFDQVDELHRDAFRVYATTAGNPTATDWILLATNNSAHLYLDEFATPENDADIGLADFNSRLIPNEFDDDPNDMTDDGLRVQFIRELYDNSRLLADEPTDDAQVRQAVISLADFAGSSQVSLRFEFSTEGAIDELVADRFSNPFRIPLRSSDLTDNQLTGDDNSSVLEVSVGNVVIGASGRGQTFDQELRTTEDGMPIIPALVAFPESVGGVVSGDYQIIIRPARHDAFDGRPPDPMVNTFNTNDSFSRLENDAFSGDGFGDTNRFREQGQLILHSNQITASQEYGVRLEVSPLIPAGAADLVIPNAPRLVRGPVVENNLIVNSGMGGILIAGDESGVGAVSFSRIINNTIVGDASSSPLPGSTGIEVGANASPTLLNNVIAYTGESITTQASSTSTVVAGSVFHSNLNNAVTGESPVFSTAFPAGDGSDGLFRNPLAGNFLLVDGAVAIDSALNSQEDRPAITSVYSSLGLNFSSSIVAPERDLLGQLRLGFDSPQSVDKDRGAFERVDQVGPRAQLLTPVDNDTNDLDDPDENDRVITLSGPFNFFAIRLFDIDVSGNNLFGVGIDDASVIAAPITLRRDGQALVENLDYTLSYDSTSDIIRVIPVAGVWTNATYEIEIGNSEFGTVTDLAGNPLAGSTTFLIDLLDEPGPEGDYGDAPLPFATRFADGGAVHLDTSTLFLGAAVDRETNGFPSLGADGDAFDDGIAFADTTLFLGNTSTLTATASAAGFLDAWIDFNVDGVWAPDEQIFASEEFLSASAKLLTVDIPADATLGDTYARFRFSSDATGLAPGGEASDGEVEDYLVTVADAGTDFGDAPNPYPEASHRIVPGFHLGATNSDELETSVDDASDDGAVFAAAVVNLGAETSVTVTSSASGVLFAWIDYNADGSWDDPGEQLFGGPVQLDGALDLAFTVPADAMATTTYARFRFSDGSTTLGPGGTATNGEVEDYMITFIDTSANWHNETSPEDVNASGQISPLDALLVINELNERNVSDPVTGLLDLPANPPPFYDVSGPDGQPDGRVSPIDALTVINALNASSARALVAGNSGWGPLDGVEGADSATVGLAGSVASGAESANQDVGHDLAMRSFLPTRGRDEQRYDDIRSDDDEQEQDVLDDVFALWP